GAPLLLFPEALVCLPAAGLFWLIAKQDRPITFAPLLVGFAVSMVGLALSAYVESQGEDPPGRWFVFDASVVLLVVLPLISFVVLPITAVLVRRRCLTLRAIGLSALIGWVPLSLVVSLVGWYNTSALTAPPECNGKRLDGCNGKFYTEEEARAVAAYHLSDLKSDLKSTFVPVLIYGLPIPLMTLWFLRRRTAMPAEGEHQSG
ncbi:MAG TPA: hypothetical protein VGR70_03195, partial [Stellaceae bacterium]|nr:hypothetical protein [Stellaceae bacterium]